MYYISKRIFDIIGALVVLSLCLPLLLGTAMLIAVCMGRPVFFYQLRPGLHSKLFRLVKFRTMRNDIGTDSMPLPDAARLTHLGRLLRAVSLDELPQLWNVLKGDMSLVGPRPLLPEYLERYSARQSRRHDVHPGITGWAQINGRNALAWEDKFELDVWYVEHQSFWLDCRILGKTFAKVLKREGINYEGEATMQPFFGIVGCCSAQRNSSGRSRNV